MPLVLLLVFLFLTKAGAHHRRRLLASCLFAVVGLAGAATGPWHLKSTKDEITGVSSFEGRMSAAVESNGRRGTADVFATCDDANLSLRIVYFSASKENPGFQYEAANILLAKPHVFLRMSIDGVPRQVTAQTFDHPNEVTIGFVRPPSKLVRDAEGGGGGIVRGIVAVTGLSAGTPADAFGANMIKIELPLGNGDRPILEIRPQDPEFQRFATKCNAVADERDRALQEDKRQEQVQQEQETIRTSGPLIQKYGLPAISDSHDTLVWKALAIKDKSLQGYWYSTEHDPLNAQKRTGPGTVAASGAPGSACGTIYDPGDVAPNSINWEASEAQFVVVRCKDNKGNHVWGQMELTPAGLEELKKRRAQLLELGVKGAPAPSEPDTPAGPKPERWTRAAWASKTFYVCPSSQFRPNPPGPPSFAPQQPTLVQLVAHPATFYYLGKPQGEAATAYEFRWDALHEDAGSCSSTSATASVPATLTVTGSSFRSFTRIQYWVIDDPLAALHQAGLGVSAGTTPSQVLRTACDHGESTCEKVRQSFDANAVSKGSPDATGTAVLPSLPAGRHYLILYAASNDHASISFQNVDLKPGSNSVLFYSPSSPR